MSNMVPVDFDADPNGLHHEFLEAYLAYINAYEKFQKKPSFRTKRECKRHLLKVQRLTVPLRRELEQVHRTVIELRNEVFAENKRQREIKKANKGK